MSEQIVMPRQIGAANSLYKEKAQNFLEKARLAHENIYLTKKVRIYRKPLTAILTLLSTTRLFLKLIIVWHH